MLKAQRHEVRIGMVELFWGLLWRTSLSGLVFGAVLGAVFGTALPTPSGMGHLGFRGALFGTFAGAIEGLTLGVLCGLPLFTTTRGYYSQPRWRYGSLVWGRQGGTRE